MTNESLRDLEIREVYNPGKHGEDVVGDFIVPALGMAKSYRRVAGYFSSTSLAVAAQGIARLVSGGGIYQLVSSHHLTPQDLNKLDEAGGDASFNEALIEDFVRTWKVLGELDEAIRLHHAQAMIWLLMEGRLEIRIVVPFRNEQTVLDKSLVDTFHPKFGLITDFENNVVAFGGSANESLNAWKNNLENVMVYDSWTPAKAGYIRGLEESFRDYWNGEKIPGWKTISLPDAVKNRLVDDFCPEDFPALPASYAARKPVRDVFHSGNQIRKSPTSEYEEDLWEHQLLRVNEWLESQKRGLLEMATGSGKTRTAKRCIEEVQKEGPSVTVVAVPYRHIGDQWADELESMNPIIVDGSTNWRKTLAKLVSRARMDQINQVVIIGVNDTVATDDFQRHLGELISEMPRFMFVGDEVHWLGAVEYQSALNAEAIYRLGLSATPKRYFDDEGSDVLFNYFENRLTPFNLANALTTQRPDTGETILCPYEYRPVIVELDEDEIDDYKRLTQRIFSSRADEDPVSRARKEVSARIQRSRVSKKAKQKIAAFDDLISKIRTDLSHCLVYCEDSEQLSEAATVLNRHKVAFNQITGAEESSPSEKWAGLSQRSHYLQSFEKGELKVLLAMKCLDEGVDIPSARIGILLASSGNSKEFIQRRGRLMRRDSGKKFATIYDFVVRAFETRDDTAMIKSERRRIDEFAEDALNMAEVHAMFGMEEVI